MVTFMKKTRTTSTRSISRIVLPLLFLGGLLLSSLTMPRPVVAEPIMAVIVTADLPRYQQVHEAMVKVLQAGGFGEGKLKIFKQTPGADKMSLVNSLRRAEAAGATLVVTYGSQATAIAKDELKKTPLLFADVYDPVALGAVKTLKAPGTDASGATSKTDLGALVDSLCEDRRETGFDFFANLFNIIYCPGDIFAVYAYKHEKLLGGSKHRNNGFYSLTKGFEMKIF